MPIQQWLLVTVGRLHPATRVRTARDAKSVLVPVDPDGPHNFLNVLLREVQISALQVKEKGSFPPDLLQLLQSGIDRREQSAYFLSGCQCSRQQIADRNLPVQQTVKMKVHPVLPF